MLGGCRLSQRFESSDLVLGNNAVGPSHLRAKRDHAYSGRQRVVGGLILFLIPWCPPAPPSRAAIWPANESSAVAAASLSQSDISKASVLRASSIGPTCCQMNRCLGTKLTHFDIFDKA